MKAINYAYLAGVIEGSLNGYKMYLDGVISIDQVDAVNEYLKKKFKEAERKAEEYANK